MGKLVAKERWGGIKSKSSPALDRLEDFRPFGRFFRLSTSSYLSGSDKEMPQACCEELSERTTGQLLNTIAPY